MSQEWKELLLGEITYLYVVAIYTNVQEIGQARNTSVLVTSGVTPEGERQFLRVSAHLSERKTCWRSFINSQKIVGNMVGNW